MSRFWSPIVENLSPYVPGEQPKGQDLIKLNTNENPYGPSPRALEAIRAVCDPSLRLYPDPQAAELRSAIAAGLGMDSKNIFIGNGSDEILAHAFNAFFRGKPPLLFADITYSFYPTYCRLYEIDHRIVPLDDAFQCDPDAYRGEGGGIVIANPNAPTGMTMGLAEIEHILKQNPDAVVLVDEAYVDFGGESAAVLVPAYDNLLVIQTFSKSRSLAGLRVGFAVAQPHLIEALVRVKDSFNSYPIDRLALAGALAAWEDRDWFEETRQRVIEAREQTRRELQELDLIVLSSSTNFLFASHVHRPAETIAGELRSRRILVRHFRQERIRNWLRISIGTHDECGALIRELREILAKTA